MTYEGPYRYQLIITGPEKARRIQGKLDDRGSGVPFTKPVTNSKQPKIYIIQNGKDIVYVGYASQSIGSRISGGLKANGKNGYHGYGWKKLDMVTLTVFVFEPFVGVKNADIKHRLFVEAIEAELVYLVRGNTSKWPEHQSEIHFNNRRLDEVKALAKEIYEKLNINVKPFQDL